MAANTLGSKSPNMQSPPNVSVSKNIDPQMVVSLGNLPSSIASSLSNNQMSIANSMGGMQSSMSMSGNNATMSMPGGMNTNLVMTSSAAGNNMGGMAGGGLIVANSLNKQPINTATMMGAGNPQGLHHPGAHAGVQMQNGPGIMNARAAALQQQQAQQQAHMVGGPTRGQSPHQQIHQVGIVPPGQGPRMQAPPNMSTMANMGQMGATSNPYAYGKYLNR